MPNKVILFADDSATMRTIMENTFAAEPYDVVAVPSGEMAINKSKKINPAIIIADAGMVGISGYDVYKAVREDASLNNVPVMLVAGVSDPYDENRGRELGITEYMKKPFDTTQLIDKVNELTAGIEPIEQPEVAELEPEDEAIPAEKPLPSFKELTSRPPEAFAEPGGFTPPAVSTPFARPQGDMQQASRFSRTKSRAVTQSFEAVRLQQPEVAEQNFGELNSSPEAPEPEPIPVAETPALEVEPISIDEQEDDQSAFHVGTLAELAQMDGRGEQIPYETADDAIDLPDAPELSQDSDVPVGEAVVDEEMPVVELLEEDEVAQEEELEVAEVAEDEELEVAEEEEEELEVAEVAEDEELEVAEVAEPEELVRKEARAAARAMVQAAEGLTAEQAQLLTELTVEVIEKVVWEVVPDLAETIIKEQLAKLLEE